MALNKSDGKPESPPDGVELVVTQEEYDLRLKRGWTDEQVKCAQH